MIYALCSRGSCYSRILVLVVHESKSRNIADIRDLPIVPGICATCSTHEESSAQ